MKTIQQHKQNATLNKVFRFEEGIMSRRDWLKIKSTQGWKAEERTRRNYAAEEKLQNWLDREKFNVPLGNSNYPSTKIYLQEKERLINGIFKTEYALTEVNGSGVYDISKTEFDYFQNMQLSEDINTQKLDVLERIEAGIATDEEIQEDEDKELQFFIKYAN